MTRKSFAARAVVLASALWVTGCVTTVPEQPPIIALEAPARVEQAAPPPITAVEIHPTDEAAPSGHVPELQLALGAGSRYFLADLEPAGLQEAKVVEREPLAIQVAADERPRFDPDLSVQRTRAYLALRYGRAFFADTEPVDGFGFEESFGQELIGGSIGFNWGRYLGAEISVDGWETDVSQDGLGDIQEHAVSTVLLQGRLDANQ